MPNSIGHWETTVRIIDEERRKLWEQVFDDACVPVELILPVRVNVPERGEVDAYMLDLMALPFDQVEKLCEVLSKRFDIPVVEVLADVVRGVPIVAEGVSLNSTDLGQVLSLMCDDDDLFYEGDYEL